MKTLKRLVSSLLVFSMVASMFVTVTATTNESELIAQSTQKTEDYDIVDNIYIDGKLDMDIRMLSTVLSSSQSYSDVLGYNSRLDSVYFPSVIELQYQQNPNNNGKLIAATAIGETGRPDDVDPSLGTILESTDGGATWDVVFRPVETAASWFWAGQMAHIYELPAQLGDMPAGTIIYTANTVNYGDIDDGGTFKGYSHISAWRSLDAGKTWEQYTIVRSVTDGGSRLGVWEPVMFYDNGYLYCFYSDDSYGTDTLNGLEYGPDQKIVYQRSADGVNWEAPVDVYTPATLTDRPGMPVITKMGNGEYFLVYENGKADGDCYIYYKKTSDITNWNASDPGQLLTAKVDGKDYKMASSPCCVWSPAGGDCGTLFAMGRREFGGDGTIRMFVSFDYGKTWDTIENPIAYDWYTSASAGLNDSIGYRPIMVLGSDPSVIHYINTTEANYAGGTQVKYAQLKIYDNDNPNEDKNEENYQKKVVFRVANGRWNDGTTAYKTVYVTLSHNGVWNVNGSGTLSTPAVGGMPYASFAAGSWDVTPPSTVSGTQTVTYTYTYKFSAAKTLSVGSATISVGNIRTVLSHSAGPHFPSVIELKHQSDPSNNGKLIAAMSLFDGTNETMACITQSIDGGKTWSVLSHPKETINPYVWGGNMGHIYELPDQLGEYLPAGTLIYSSVSVDYEYYSHIGVWASVDCGQSWTEISTVAAGAGDGFGIWEPVMFYDNGYLYCFYSDDTGDGITAPDQKIVYQRTKDGFNWEAPVNVCSLSDYAARPGMPVITKMGNGEYFLVYEYVYTDTASYVYYKKTSDITNWNPSDMGSRISVKSGSKTYYPAAAPSCVWTPAGGDNGMLFVTGQYQGGGVPYNCVFVSTDYGKTWTIMENPLPYSNYKKYEEGILSGYRPIMVTGTDPSVIHYISMTTNTEVQYVTLKVNNDGTPNQGKNPLDYQKKVVFKVANGKWNDGTADDKVFYVTLEKNGVWDTSGSASISIPAVGNRPNTNFGEGKWIVAPTTTVSGTESVTYTYVYAHDPYENCVNAFGPVLNPDFVNGICWEYSSGKLKMPAGYENSFLLFGDKLVNNRVEATIVINDLTSSDANHRNGIVFALTDHDGDFNFAYDGTDVSYYWAFINDWGCVEVIEMGKYQNWHWLTTNGVDLAALGIDVTKGVKLAAQWDNYGHIKVYANGILVQDITDSTPLTGNYYGILINDWDNTQTPSTHNAYVTSFVADLAVYENCTDAGGNLLTPVLVNGIFWEISNGELKMTEGHENSFLLFSNPLVGNRVEATIAVRDNLYGDNNHRNGIVFALTDHDGDLKFNYDGNDVSYYWAFINDYGCVEVVEMGRFQNWVWLSSQDPNEAADLGALGIDITKGVKLTAQWDNYGHIKIYANGILVQDITDSTPLTGSYYGLLVNKYGNYDPSFGAYDAPVTSFVAGELFAELGESVNLGGNVTLTGKTLTDGAFTFQLYSTSVGFEVSGSPISTTKNANGKFSFNVSYTTSDIGKTFYYVIKEVNGGKTIIGITYSSDIYQITVKVESDGQGGVKTKVMVEDGATHETLDFVNSYNVTGEATVNLGGSVSLTGKTLADDMFTFELYDANSSFATSGTPKTTTNKSGKFSFTFSYTAADIGTHYYVLKEANAGTTVNGIAYSSVSYNITVKVTDNGSGGLRATVIGVTANALNFANSYAVTEGTEVNLGGNVTLIGKTLANGMFTFELYNANASFTTSGTPKTASNTNGKFAFTLNYAVSEVGKTYYYVLKQANAGEMIDGVAHSTKTYQITVQLKDNGQGAIKATVTVKDGTAANALDFENTVKYSITVDSEGNLLTPFFVNDIYWELSDGNLKMPAGHENSFLLFSDTLANNRVEATIVVRDNINGDANHRNGIVFALTDHDGDGKFNYVEANGVAATDVSYYWAFVNDYGCVEVIEMGKYQNWHWLSTQSFDLATLGIDVTQGVTLAAEWDDQGNIRVYANGILVQEVVDDTPLTGNYYGVLVNKWGNTQDADYEYPYDAPVTSIIAGESFAGQEVSVTVGGSVTLTGKDIADGEFTFELYDASGIPLQMVTNKGGKFEFTLGYNEINAGRIFNYIVKQINVGASGMTYDAAEYYLTVIPTKNHGGIAIIIWEANGTGIDSLNYANTYAPTEAEIDITVTGEGTVEGAGKHEIGTTVTLTATPGTGYVFEGWYENGTLVSSDATYIFTAQANRTLTAKFEKNTYTVSVTPEEGGTVTGAGSYKLGATVTLTATADEGYTFEGWYENGELISADATITFTAEANRDLTAEFAAEVAETVFGDANGDGEVGMDDVVCIRKYIAAFNYGTNTSSESVEAGADFNGDGVVNMKDVILLRQYIVNHDYE